MTTWTKRSPPQAPLGTRKLIESTMDFASGGGLVFMYKHEAGEVGTAFECKKDAVIDSLVFSLAKLGSPTGLCRAKFYSASGTPGSNGLPNELLAQATIATEKSVSTLPILGVDYEDVVFTLDRKVRIVQGGYYVTALEYLDGLDVNNCLVVEGNSIAYHNGNLYTKAIPPGSFIVQVSNILKFGIYGRLEKRYKKSRMYFKKDLNTGFFYIDSALNNGYTFSQSALDNRFYVLDQNNGESSMGTDVDDFTFVNLE